MRLVRLELHRLPGIDAGFELTELAPGVNVVLGPNTSGKSSLARAFLTLLQPGGDGNAASLAAQLEDREGPLAVERRHEPRARWMREGQAVEAPALLEPELLHGLVIRAEDLASAESTSGLGAALTLRIERELAGGFDLARARALDALKEKQQPGRVERAELSSARDARRRVEGKQRELREAEGSLEELRARCRAARSAGAGIERVQRALELLELRGQVRNAEAALEVFPAELAQLSGDALVRLRAIEARLETAREQRREAERVLAEAREELERAALGELAVGSDEVEELGARLEELRRTLGRLADARQAEAGAAAQLARIHQALGSQRAPSSLVITADEVERALGALEALAPLRADQAAVTRLVDGLPAEGPAADRLRSFRRGLEALDDWLQAPRAGVARADRWAWGSFALLAIAGLLLALTAAHPLLQASALVLVALGLLLRLRSAGAASDGTAARARESFESSQLEPPRSWEPSFVRARREELALELAEGERRRAEHEQRLEGLRRLERLKGEIEAAQAELEPLAGRLGFDPRRLDESRLRWHELLRQHDEALAHLADAEAAREGLEEASGVQCAFLAAALAPVSSLSAGERDPHALDTALRDLRRRVALRDGARSKLEGARRDLEGARDRIENDEAEWSELYEQAGVPAGDRAELERRVERVPLYITADQAAKDARARADGLAESLRERPDLLALVEADEAGALAGLRAELEAKVEEAARLANEIAGIEKELELARAGHSLEEALDRVRRAERALEERVEEQLLAAAGQLLLDRVEALHRRERTGALKRAERWFARSTHHTFELEVRQDRELRLEARDVRANERRTLEQLSTATRVQLLLAVRLAFLEEAEAGREPLPLFLDEVLATSDPERSAAIIDVVAELARAGRQVFYLTAQPDEAARWMGALGEGARLHDLALVRGLASAARPAELAPPPPYTVPAPLGRTPEQYAALLGVPALDPWREDATHLYYLLSDHLELLHRVLQRRYEHLGPLEGLLADARAGALLEPAELDELRCRVALTRTLLAAWREGRGRPLDPARLAQHDAISETFREQVLALAQECELDAQSFIERLAKGAVPRFRTDRREELRDWLLEAGYLVETEPLPAAELRLRTAAAASSFPLELRAIAPRLADGLLARLAPRASKTLHEAELPAQGAR